MREWMQYNYKRSVPKCQKRISGCVQKLSGHKPCASKRRKRRWRLTSSPLSALIVPVVVFRVFGSDGHFRSKRRSLGDGAPKVGHQRNAENCPERLNSLVIILFVFQCQSKWLEVIVETMVPQPSPAIIYEFSAITA